VISLAVIPAGDPVRDCRCWATAQLNVLHRRG